MFVIAEPASCSVCTPQGEIDFTFKPGEHTPKTPDEQIALEFLAQIGVATVQATKSRPRRSTKQGE